SWTPNAPTASATSTRSLTRNVAPASAQAAARGSASRNSSPPDSPCPRRCSATPAPCAVTTARARSTKPGERRTASSVIRWSRGKAILLPHPPRPGRRSRPRRGPVHAASAGSRPARAPLLEPVAGPRSSPADPFGRRHPPPPGRRDLPDVDPAPAARDEDPLRRIVPVGFQDRTGRGVVGVVRHRPRPEELEFAPVPRRPRAGHGVHPADRAVDAHGVERPVDPRVLPRQPRHVRRLRLVLLDLLDLADLEERERLDQRGRADLAQPGPEVARAFVLRDRDPDLVDDRAGVHPLDHPHDRHASLTVAADDRPVDRRRAPQLRQERGVHVDRAERRQLEHLPPEDLAVRDDDRDVRLERAELGQERVASRPLGLEDRDPLLERDTLDRRGLHRPPAARRAVGLRDDADHIVPLAEQRPERRDREVRRAPEEDPHTTPTVRNASTIRLRLHLLPALQQHLPLERADPIDEEDAVQVVDLVLERTGQEPLGLDPDGPAVPVQPLDDDAGRALDDLLQPRDAETPLLVSLDLVARLEDDRIHEAERLDPRLPDIDDDDAAADPDLRRGEA